MFPARALFTAAVGGDTSVLEEAEDDDLRVFDPITGDTLAHVATQNNRINVVRLIAERTPDVFVVRNIIGRTALLEAVMYDHIDIAKVISDADPRTILLKDLYGYSPLASVKLLDVLGDDAWAYTTPMIGYTVLHEAVMQNLADLAERALQKIPNAVRIPTIDGMTPIHFAAFLGRTEIAKILLREHPDCIAFVTNRNKTPLFCASEYSPWKNSDIIRMLFAERPDLAMVQDDRGRTPVFEIAKIGVADDVRFMLEKYPELALVRERELGWTPLHAALYGRYNSWVEMAKTIVTACPDALTVKDDSGKTPIDHVHHAMDPREDECGTFLSHVLRYAPLPDDVWDYIPEGCKDMSGALGAALERSSEEAARVVRKMTDEHRERLRTALMVISREQSIRNTYSEDVTRRIISNVF